MKKLFYFILLVIVTSLSLLQIGDLYVEASPAQYVDSSIVTSRAPELTSGVAKEYFDITQELHTDLELYSNELISLINRYLYREKKLMIDDLIAQILPVFKGYISNAKHMVRTVNRLFYLEFFHLEWEQANPKALQVIDDYVSVSVASLETDSDALSSIPRNVPSMIDLPLVREHFQKTQDMLQMTIATLQRIKPLDPSQPKGTDV